MAMRLFDEELSDDSDHLQKLLFAIDKMVFDENPDEGSAALDELEGDDDLVNECLVWRQRFFKPDAEEVRKKWKVHMDKSSKGQHETSSVVKLESMITGRRSTNHEVIVVQNEQEQNELTLLMQNVKDGDRVPKFRSSSADHAGKRRYRPNPKFDPRQTSTAEASTLRLPRIE